MCGHVCNGGVPVRECSGACDGVRVGCCNYTLSCVFVNFLSQVASTGMGMGAHCCVGAGCAASAEFSGTNDRGNSHVNTRVTPIEDKCANVATKDGSTSGWRGSNWRKGVGDSSQAHGGGCGSAAVGGRVEKNDSEPLATGRVEPVVESEKTLLNRAQRHRNKERKKRKQARAMGQPVDLAEVENPVDAHPNAFWKNCKDETRRRLIESKAEMHIAENERRARVARDEVKKMDSGYHAMMQAIKMIETAQKLAKKENDNKVLGWAQTVATSSAESMAKSAPDSVPSFESYVTRTSIEDADKISLLEHQLAEEKRKNEASDAAAKILAAEQESKLRLAVKNAIVENERALLKRIAELEKMVSINSQTSAFAGVEAYRLREFEPLKECDKAPFADTHPLAGKVVARRPNESRQSHIIRANVFLKAQRKRLIPLDA